MSDWNIFRRSVAVEKTPQSKADPAWDQIYSELIAAEKETKSDSRRAAITAPAKPRRGWFGRTFVEPVKRFLSLLIVRLIRFVVTVVAILVAGNVCLTAIDRWWPAQDIVTPAPQTFNSSTPAASSSPQSSSYSVSEKRETQKPRPRETWVDPYTRKDGTHVNGHIRKLGK